MNKNIKKYVLTAGLLGSLFLSTTFVYAESRLENLVNEAKERSDKSKERVQQLREEMQEKIKERREKIQQKIAEIKDKQKQELANKINNQLSRVNEVWTDHFSNVLGRLDEIMQKIETRTEKASANGEDVSKTKFAIQNAIDKISVARTAVTNQAQKTYVADTSSITGNTSTNEGQINLMNKLREQFKQLRDQLFSDLKGLRDGSVKDARTAVQDALKELSKVPKVNEEPEVN